MELAVQKREKFGKAVSTLRQQGLIPAELYGRGVENLHLAIPVKEFKKVFKQAGESSMVNVVLGNEKRPVMISGVATDPVTDEVLSVDFYQVRLDEKIKIKVPLEFTGEAPAIKDFKGILVKAMQELEVEALPTNIPRSLIVDLTKLAAIGQSVYAKDLAVPSDVKLLVGPEAVIATVTAQMTEEQEAKLAAEVKPEDIKVETEEKKEARAAEKSATGEGAAAPASAEAAVGKPEKK